MTRLFCLGLGYTAEALARRVRPLGWHIAGTARTPEGVARIKALGHDAILFDGKVPAPEVADAIAAATQLLISAGPDDEGDPTLRHHGRDIADAPDLLWIGYLSTIGVYGDSGGEWVDETTMPKPGSERTRRRLKAEDDWLAFGRTFGKTVQVFRLGGIYGAGRSAVDDLRDGTARRIIKPGQVFNRIHVEDIAGALEAAIDTAPATRIFNVTDDEPAPPQDVIAHAAELLGVAPPPEQDFETAELSPMARSFYGENKRVSNDRVKRELGYAFRYPDYRTALAALHRNGWR